MKPYAPRGLYCQGKEGSFISDRMGIWDDGLSTLTNCSISRISANWLKNYKLMDLTVKCRQKPMELQPNLINMEATDYTKPFQLMLKI